MDPALWELLRAEEDDATHRPVEAIIRLARPGVEISGVRMVARFGPIATCRLPAEDVLAVRAHPEVVSLKAARRLGVGGYGHAGGSSTSGRPDRPRPGDVRRPPGLAPTGAGVVLGCVDWGADVDSAAFKRAPGPGETAGGTRFLALWDQRDQAVGPRPEPYGYGVVHDRGAIDRALRESRPYQALGYHPASADRGHGTHGTHVLDIAAGNGGAGGPVGIAPEADLVFVHLADRDTGGLANLGDSVRLLEAIDFIRRTAGTKPCVINSSVGRIAGPHDGSTLVEMSIDQMLATTPGILVVKSAGNYVRTRAHACGTLAPGEVRTLTFLVDPDDATPNELEIWYDGRDELCVRLDPPGQSGGRWVSLGDRADLTVDGRVVGRVYHRATDPNNGANQVDAFLYPAGCAGSWTVTLEALRVRSGRFHAWLERDDFCPRCQARFTAGDSNRSSTTGTLANGHLDLVVGAYDGRDPTRPPAPFSSAGPTLDGRPKPDMAAPGVGVLAARSADAGSPRSTGLQVRKSGTSMAAPHVAGAVALCLQLAGRRLGADALRSLVLASCELPRSPDPEGRLGHGYLDIPRLLSAMRAALAVPTAGPHPTELSMDTDATLVLASAPATAYREFLYRPRSPLARLIDDRYDVLARSGQRPDRAPQPGDVLLEIVLGRPGLGRCTVLDDGELSSLGAGRRLPHGQLLLRPHEPDAAAPAIVDPETLDTEDVTLDRLIDQGLAENQITNALFYARNPGQVGTTLKQGTRAAGQWLTIRDDEVRPGVRQRLTVIQVDPVVLAVFLSQYENDSRVPAEATTRFLTGSPLLSMGRTLRDRVLGNWRSGQEPLTARRLFTLALEVAGDAGTAALLCHNVTKAFVREGVAITWRGTGIEGEYTDGQKTYRAEQRHRSGRLTYYHPKKRREAVSIFYLLFSAKEFGTVDPGDWYHFFVTATVAALAGGGALGGSGGRGRREDMEDSEGGGRGGRIGVSVYRGLLGEQVADLERQMSDRDLAAVPGYRGWVLANVLSFLEGGHYGADFTTGQSDVERESRIHLRGAAFGLKTIGGSPGRTWHWYVPMAGSLSDVDLATGYRLQDKTWQVWGPDGKPQAAGEDVDADLEPWTIPEVGAGLAEAPPKSPPAKVPKHVIKARKLWKKLFGTDKVLSPVALLDYEKVPSEAVREIGYDAWTNSATKVYVASSADANESTLETTVQHEALHVRQFAKDGGPPSTYQKMVEYERDAYLADQKRLTPLVEALNKLQRRTDDQEERWEDLTALLGRVNQTVDLLQKTIKEVTVDPKTKAKTADESERRFRRTLISNCMLPYHHKLIHLYQPPTEDLNPSRESGEDVEQAVAMPRVTAFRFRNTGASDPDNNCANCPITLGIGVGGTARNGMELRFTIDGHRAGMEYDITRTRRDSFWQRDAGVWSELGSNPMGTNDDHHDNDEWLIPRRGFIYAIDRPGYATLTLGTPATPLGGGTLWPGAVTSATAQDVVLRYSFAEWVIARHRGEGIPWTPLELPPMRDGTPRRFVFWRCVVWITRDGAGNFVLDVPRCRIERGSFSAAVLNAAPT